jgi:hypothetical protein
MCASGSPAAGCAEEGQTGLTCAMSRRAEYGNAFSALLDCGVKAEMTFACDAEGESKPVGCDAEVMAFQTACM